MNKMDVKPQFYSMNKMDVKPQFYSNDIEFTINHEKVLYFVLFHSHHIHRTASGAGFFFGGGGGHPTNSRTAIGAKLRMVEFDSSRVRK